MGHDVLTFEDFASHFRGARPDPANPRYWRAFCPLHKGGAERRPSFRLWQTDEGVFFFGCYVCGREPATKKAMLAAVGLRFSVCFPDGRKPGKNWHAKPMHQRRPVAHYDYVDEHGQLLYRVIRWHPKDFNQWTPDWESNRDRPPSDPRHGFRQGLGDTRRVLYRLPDLAAHPGKTVFLCEGERKADWVCRHTPFVGTCNVGGSGMSWSDDYNLPLAGRSVVVLPDNDKAGLRHADGVVGSLVRSGLPASVRVLLLPGLPPKGDVLDWAKAGGTPDQLLVLLSQAREYKL